MEHQQLKGAVMASQQEQLRVQELGDFLRTRRGRIAPELVGLPRGERRRTPGLRRAEVAQLAGVSVDWYTWLEQGRPISVSIQVLESLVQALQLDANEREHLFFLAHQQPPPEGTPLRETVSATLQHFLDHLDLSPAFAIGPRWDIVAWNDAARVVLYDFPHMTSRERNVLWLTFASASHRQRIVDWDKHARRILAQFRTSYGRFPGDPWMTELIAALQTISPEFRAWWSDHEVLRGPEGQKVLKHPQAGILAFEHLMFQMYDEPDLKVVVYTPIKEGETGEKIRQLLAQGHGTRGSGASLDQ
ncbi:helix-turn-helix transcriptional regulator [Ktedonobacter racemifer]|uniref:Helix-turn-helix domain protein n=1 Tax=Ktedonobacter racemifer DSM 44963 TaxID=485913 RepID=D6U1I8_KTERA|nr:helix-turn-helix transcriptional regulator [Ktedonobacter racemifer]EFH82632.1 helix-turn-helix domain protein [Ktedonobacter racemifer DSM 44963]